MKRYVLLIIILYNIQNLSAGVTVAGNWISKNQSENNSKKVSVAFKPSLSISKNNTEIDPIDVVTMVLDLVEESYNTYKLYQTNSQGVKTEISQEQYKRISAISGTGEDFTGDINLAYIMYKLVRGQGSGYIIKKITEVEMKFLENSLGNSFVINGGGERTSYHYNGSTTIEGTKYFLNCTLVKIADEYGQFGHYIMLTDFALYPQIQAPIGGFLAQSLVRFYITFDKADQSEILSYPSLKTYWGTLNTNNNKLIYEIDPGLVSEIFSPGFVPHLQIGVFKKNFWGTEKLVSYFDLNEGTINSQPQIPQLWLTEKENSLKLNWNTDPNSTSYNIYRDLVPITEITPELFYTTVNNTTFEDNNVTPGKRYYYKILPFNNSVQGTASNQVNGIARAKYIISLNQIVQTDYLKGSNFTISGKVISAISNLPIQNPELSFNIKEINYSFGKITGAADGTFTKTLEVPTKTGNYIYEIIASKNGIIEKINLNINSFEDINNGYDLEVNNLDIGELVKTSGQNINTSLILKNNGILSQTSNFYLSLYNENNELIKTDQFTLTINSKNSYSHSTNFLLPTLQDGTYYLKAYVSNNQDYDKSNNFKRITFKVSSATDPPAYRLSELIYSQKGQSFSVDGIPIRLDTINNNFCRFTVNGESTGNLSLNDVWCNNSKTCFIILTNNTYINDSTFEVKIRAGGIHNEFSFSNYHIAFKKTTSKSVDITAPAGSDLNADIKFILDPDSTNFKNWLSDVTKVSNNILRLFFKVPKATSPGTYFSMIKVVDNANYWWLKKMYLSPLKGHEISTIGDLNVVNITAGNNPGNKTGDRFLVQGNIKNYGDFDENVPVNFTFSSGDTTVWSLNQNIALNKNNTSTFQYPVSTIGLKDGLYNINIKCSEPEDYTQDDNNMTGNILLEAILKLNCSFNGINSFYNPNDIIPIKLDVKHNTQLVDSANVTLTIETPEGRILNDKLTYNSQTGFYEGSLINNIGGNYYLTANIECYRYETDTISKVIKSKIKLKIKGLRTKDIAGNTKEMEISASLVGGIYAFAADIVTNNSLGFQNILEGSLINQDGLYPSTFQHVSSGMRTIIGISRMNQSGKPSFTYQEKSLISLSYLIKSVGQNSISLENVGLLDKRGNNIVYDIYPYNFNSTAETTLVKLSFADRVYEKYDTIKVTSSALLLNNMRGISYNMNYDSDKLQYIDTKYDSSLGEYGAYQVANNAAIFAPGDLSVGCIRTGHLIPGLNSSVVKFTESRFKVIKDGAINFSLNNIHLFSPFEEVEYPYTISVEPSIVSVNQTESQLSFYPDTIRTPKDSISIVSLNISSVANVFSCAGEFIFDKTKVQVQQLIEGNLFNSDGISTTFLYTIDTVANKVTFGLTRLGAQNGGVSTNSTKTVFKIKIKKLKSGMSSIQFQNMLFSDNLGNSIGEINLPVLYIVPPQPQLTWQSTISLKDNGNSQQTLLFGMSPLATNDIDSDLGEASLTPIPVTGIFDARFQLPITPSDFSICDYRPDTLHASIWNILFQPGSEGYPFTITWDSTSLPQGYFYLKDIISGSVVNIDMKAQSSYTLSNQAIHILKIEYSKQICSNVSLTTGWNILSVPLTAPVMNTQTLFPNYTSPTYGFSNSYTTAITLSSGKGYWLRYASAAAISICGTNTGAVTIPLNQGWNLIGGYVTDITVANITTTPSGIISSPFYGYANGYIVPTILKVGKGYWVRASQSGVINIPSGLMKTSNEVIIAGEIKSEWGRIIVTDNEGRNGVLYAAKGNVNLSSFDLPPVPPADVFDLRFGTDRNVEVLDNQGKEIKISSKSYPVTIKAEGISFRINDKITGKLLDQTLLDGKSIILQKDYGALRVIKVEKPISYTLDQNYPNPFNPSTKIRYSIPFSSNVKISIYNSLGQLVKELVNQSQEANFYEIQFDASKLSSGFYIYRIQAASVDGKNNFSTTKKMMLIK